MFRQEAEFPLIPLIRLPTIYVRGLAGVQACQESKRPKGHPAQRWPCTAGVGRFQWCQMRTRKAFTLVELLVVIGIILLLTTLSVMVFNSGRGSDRMRSAARTAQSTFRGAVDRALHAKDNRGLRLIRDPDDDSLVTGFVYLQPLGTQVYGLPSGTPLRILRPDVAPADGLADVDAATIVEGTGVDWLNLYQSGVLPFPQRIRIPSGPAGHWYTFTNLRAGTGTTTLLDLTSPYVGTTAGFPLVEAVGFPSANATADLELGFELLPNHQPIPLPSGVVIDMDWSGRIEPDPANPGNVVFRSLLAIWPAGTNIDILFTPRGGVAGRLAALGPLHLLLNDIQDATQGLNPIDPANKGEKLVLTIFPQTGNVATFPIDPTDTNADGNADDLFRFAKLGSVAAQ